MTLSFSFYQESLHSGLTWATPLSIKSILRGDILNQDSPMMEIWKLISLSFSCSGIIPKLFLTTTLYTPLSLLVIGLNWSVVRPACSLLYWVWARPSGKARPSWYHVTVVFSRNRLWNLTVKVKGRLPVISWNGGGWEVMAGGTGERERKEGGKRIEEEVGEWGSRRVEKIGKGRR